jgi:hypothetical protein
MLRSSRPRLSTICTVVLVLAGVLSATIGTSSAAHASTCYGTYICTYHAEGESGWPANGTATQVTIPTVVFTYNTYDGIAFNAFLVNNFNYDSALEAGTVFGWMNYCGENTQYFHPYGTKDNGGTESANCSYQLAPYGNAYLVRAYQSGGNGYSAVLTTGGSTIWSHNWGSYSVSNGLNVTTAEAHQNTSSYPVWSGGVDMFHSQWLDGSGHWNYWGFTNTSNDCPYHAAYYSPDAWVAYSSC